MRDWRARLCDWLILKIAPDHFFFNPKMNPFDAFEDQTKVYGLSVLAAQQLVRALHRRGKTWAEIKMTGCTTGLEETGDWIVRIERIEEEPA